MKQTTLTGFWGGSTENDNPPRPEGYLVVDLFCSVGGVSIAAKNLGHKVVLAVDFDEERLAVHACNHPGARRECFKLGPDTQELLIRLIEIEVPEHDRHRLWVHLSPPCQGQSSMRYLGKRKKSNLEDTSKEELQQFKNAGLEMVKWSLSFIEKLCPVQFSIEEVNDTQGCVRTLMSSFRANHRKLLDFDLFDMSEFGVPQTRQRLICGRPATIQNLRHNPNLKSHKVTLRDAVNVPHGAHYMHGPMSRPIKSNQIRRTGDGKYTDGFVKLYSTSLVAPTVCSKQFVWIGKPPEYTRLRKFHLCEMAVLCTFPPDFKWPANASIKLRSDGYGNAVPPLFMKKMMEASTIQYCTPVAVGIDDSECARTNPSDPRSPSLSLP